MKLLSTLAVGMAYMTALVAGSKYSYERLDKEKALLLIVDLQVGLFTVVRDFSPNEYRDNLIAHASIAKFFDMPVVMTTSAQKGANGPLPREILEMYPDAPLIERPGEVDAWDNADFRKAVEATGRKQIILASIMTDVCLTHLALSLRDAGYSVWANAEASGTSSTFVRDISNDRMRHAGVQIVSFFSIVCDLMRDWRNLPGSKEMIPFLDQHFPLWGMVARNHAAAIEQGAIQPGQEELNGAKKDTGSMREL